MILSSKNKITYISDYFVSEILGGGELNDHELLLILESRGHKIQKIKSNLVNPSFLKNNRDGGFVVSNFINLSKESRDYLTSNCHYVIYEHDHKYINSRNPALYRDYLAPVDQIVNIDFYKAAKAVFCQSGFHLGIVYKNLNIDHLYNLSGNLWSNESLNIMSILSKKQKKDCYSILKSPTLHKNTRETAFYCENKGYEYSLISSSNYQEFLSLLSNNDKFIFLPKTPETLSRVIVEARMMEIKTITNRKIGAAYEPWYSLSGNELIDVMRQKRKEIPDLVIRSLNE